MKTKLKLAWPGRLMLLFGVFVCIAVFFQACQKEEWTEEATGASDPILKSELRSNVPFCMMSWNTFLLDSPVSVGPQCEGSDCILRAQAVCNRIMLTGEPEVILLQEVFVPAAATAIMDCLSGSGYSAQFDLGSGLMTLSKFPFVGAAYFEEWDECHGNTWDVLNPFENNHGHDCFADKGFLVSNIRIEDCIIRVINLHMDAGGGAEDVFARWTQLVQLNNYINTVPNGTPLFVGGDFNIDDDDDLFGNITGALGLTPTFTLAGAAAGTTASNGIDILDYIFVRTARIRNLTVTYQVGFPQVISCYWTFTEEWFEANKHDHIRIREELFGDIFDVGPNDTPPVPNTPEDLAIWTSLEDVPRGYTAFVEEKCEVNNIEATNPSDHRPVYSCFTFDCDNTSTGGGGSSGGGSTEECIPPCPPDAECIHGQCEYQ